MPWHRPKTSVFQCQNRDSLAWIKNDYPINLVNYRFEAVVRAADALPAGTGGHFANALQRMLGQMASESGKLPFGTCSSYKHLEGDVCWEGQASYSCGFASRPSLLLE